jgi:hypothetical protein
MIQTADDGPSEAMSACIFDGPQSGNAIAGILKFFPSSVSTPVIDYDDLVRHVVQPKLDMQMLHRGSDTSFFITRRNYNT